MADQVEVYSDSALSDETAAGDAAGLRADEYGAPTPSGEGIVPCPYTVRVGVTGHRQLEHEGELGRQVRGALKRIRERIPLEHTPLHLTVVSPLAEGADRLVAREVLTSDPASTLEAPLPLPPEEYEKDFPTTVDDFRALLADAATVVPMDPRLTREEAYEAVGQYVVDHCDVLIAIWDGQRSQGRGGTAEIVAYARELGVPLIWISTESPPRVTEERVHLLLDRVLGRVLGKPLEPLSSKQRSEYVRAVFGELDDFNAPTPSATWATEADRYRATWVGQFEYAFKGTRGEGTLHPDDVQRFCDRIDWILPYYIRADQLALTYQKYIFRSADGILSLAVIAVAVVMYQILFMPDVSWLAWVEVLSLGVIGVIFLWATWGRWHERWISFRFLAEHFRSQFFMAVAGVPGSQELPSDSFYREHVSYQWLRGMVDHVWDRRPRDDLSPSLTTGLRSFLVDAWLEDQRAYFVRTCGRHSRRERWLNRATLAFLVLGLLLAVGHALSWFSGTTEKSVVWLSIVLPTVAAAIRGYSTQRELTRNAKRCNYMGGLLRDLKASMERAVGLDQIRAVARHAAYRMVSENREWFAIMEIQDIEKIV